MGEVRGPGPITSRSPSPEPVGPSKGSFLSRIITRFRKGSAAVPSSLEEVVGVVEQLKAKVLTGQGRVATDALRELLRLEKHFSKLAEKGDPEAEKISSHVKNVLTFIGIEKDSQMTAMKDRASDIVRRFREGPVDKVLQDDAMRLFDEFKEDKAIPESMKRELIHDVLEGAFQACESEKTRHPGGPSAEFYVESLPTINAVLTQGLPSGETSEAERQALIAKHRDVLGWFQGARTSFFETMKPQRAECSVEQGAEPMTERETEQTRERLFEGMTPRQQSLADPWLAEFAKFGPKFLNRMQSEVYRAGPHYVEVNGQQGVVPERELGQGRAKEFMQWCEVLEASIAGVPEEDKPKWRTAVANLMLAATNDMYDLLATGAQEGLVLAEKPQLEFSATPTGCSVLVDVEKGTCTLQRRQDVAISPLESKKAPVARLQMRTDQQVSVEHPTSVLYSVQYGATCDSDKRTQELVDRAAALKTRLQTEPITGEFLEEVEAFCSTCKDEGLPQSLVQPLALSLIHTAMRRCDSARTSHADHPTAEDYYTSVAVLRSLSSLLLPAQQDALLAQNPELAGWLKRGRDFYATPGEKVVEQFSSQPALRQKEATTIDLSKLSEEKRALVESWLPYFPDPDELAMSICRGNVEETSVNGERLIEHPLEEESAAYSRASERLAVFCQAAEALLKQLEGVPGSNDDKRKAIATLFQASIMHNVPGEAMPMDIGMSLGRDTERVWGMTTPLSAAPQYVADPATGTLSVKFQHKTHVLDAKDPEKPQPPFLLTSEARVDVKDPATARWTFSWEPIPEAPSASIAGQETPKPSSE